MTKDFKLFQKLFKEYQGKFGLGGYRIYFKFKPLAHGFAEMTVNQITMVATVTLNSDLSDEDKPYRDIKQSAKHEAIHLLLWRLDDRASSRYVMQDEIYETTEELVFKLEDLIK